MDSACSSCGSISDVQAGPSGSLLCFSCLARAQEPKCVECQRCLRRFCGSAVLACPLCDPSRGPDAIDFVKKQIAERVATPLRIDETCERCGGSLDGGVFVLRGRALCGNCLASEKDRWDVVPGSPGKGGARIRIYSEPPGMPAMDEGRNRGMMSRQPGTYPASRSASALGKTSLANPFAENKMADDACKNCPAKSLLERSMGLKKGKKKPRKADI